MNTKGQKKRSKKLDKTKKRKHDKGYHEVFPGLKTSKEFTGFVIGECNYNVNSNE